VFETPDLHHTRKQIRFGVAHFELQSILLELCIVEQTQFKYVVRSAIRRMSLLRVDIVFRRKAYGRWEQGTTSLT